MASFNVCVLRLSNPSGRINSAVLSVSERSLYRRYVLGFRPEKMSFGKVRHEVRVEVTRPDLSVRARKTYFQIPR